MLSQMKLNEDGSTTTYIQKDSPGGLKRVSGREPCGRSEDSGSGSVRKFLGDFRCRRSTSAKMEGFQTRVDSSAIERPEEYCLNCQER